MINKQMGNIKLVQNFKCEASQDATYKERDGNETEQ